MTLYNSNFNLQDYNYPKLELIDDNTLKDVLYLSRELSNGQILPAIWSFKNEITLSEDLSTIGNLLVVGPPGIGKSNFLHQLIISLLFKKHPVQLKFVLVDFKKLEFGVYKLIENHFLAKLANEEESIVTETKKAVHTINALCIEMDNRYDLLKEAGCRNIKEYNGKFIERKLNPEKGHQFLPFIILIIDELADILIFEKNVVNASLEKLIRQGNKVGLITILSTSQVVGDTLQSNLGSLIEQRVVFRLFDREDYRRFYGTVNLDIPDDEGDFLYKNEGNFVLGKSIFINLDDIERVINFIGEQRGYPNAFLLPEYIDEGEKEGKYFDLVDKDSLFEDAARLIVASQVGSTSLLQRRMKLGYNRTGRLMDQLEAAGIVGHNQGSKAREVLVKTETDLQKILDAIM